VMAALVISISSDSSEESVGSHAPRVILFGAIPTIIPVIAEVSIVLADLMVASEVGVVYVLSPAMALDLVDYSSSSDSNLPEDSSPPIPELPLVSPFLYSDDSEEDSESEPAEQRPERHESLAVHDTMVSRWRDRVASRPSLPPGSSSHNTLAPSSEFPLALVVAPPRIRRRSTIIVRLGKAIPFGRPYRSHPNGPRMLLTARKRVGPIPTHSSSDTSSGSSSDSLLGSSLVHSSGCDSSGQAHSGPSTRVASPRSIAPTPTDLLPPRKRFRDLHSLEDSGEEHMEIDVADEEAVADVGKASAADMREITVDPLAISGSYEITEIETTQRQLEAGQLIASEERVGLSDRIRSLRLDNLKVRAMLSIKRDRIDCLRWHMALSTMTITHSGMTPEAIEELINRRVEEALPAYEEARAANALEAENQSQNGSDGDNGNGGNGNGGNGNPNENGRGERLVARECTYQNFMKCQPLNFKGT
ncbi:hypothetical protein Tco_1007589, partial [Tanacetum coccineum]